MRAVKNVTGARAVADSVFRRRPGSAGGRDFWTPGHGTGFRTERLDRISKQGKENGR